MPTNTAPGQFTAPTTEAKASFAQQTLERYGELTGSPLDDNPEERFYPALDDLLADLLHLVGPERLDSAMGRALGHFRDESAGRA